MAIPFGLGIGLSLGMVGGGGSVPAVPVLVYILAKRLPSDRRKREHEAHKASREGKRRVHLTGLPMARSLLSEVVLGALSSIAAARVTREPMSDQDVVAAALCKPDSFTGLLAFRPNPMIGTGVVVDNYPMEVPTNGRYKGR